MRLVVRILLLLAAVAALDAGCNSIFGIDSHQVAPTGIGGAGGNPIGSRGGGGRAGSGGPIAAGGMPGSGSGGRGGLTGTGHGGSAGAPPAVGGYSGTAGTGGAGGTALKPGTGGTTPLPGTGGVTASGGNPSGGASGGSNSLGPCVLGSSPREHLVLELLATGGGYAEIGRSLAIQLNTVRTHVRSLYEKLGVQNRAEAVNLGWSLGLLQARRP